MWTESQVANFDLLVFYCPNLLYSYKFSILGARCLHYLCQASGKIRLEFWRELYKKAFVIAKLWCKTGQIVIHLPFLLFILSISEQYVLILLAFILGDGLKVAWYQFRCQLEQAQCPFPSGLVSTGSLILNIALSLFPLLLQQSYRCPHRMCSKIRL